VPINSVRNTALYRLLEPTRPLGLGYIIVLLKGIGRNGLVKED
jgi:hypothetical protein